MDYRAWIYEAIGNLRTASDFMGKLQRSHEKEGPMYKRFEEELKIVNDALELLRGYYGTSER